MIYSQFSKARLQRRLLTMITHWDFSILHWIADHLQTAFLDPVMIFFTFLGEFGIVWILLGALLLCRPRFRRAGGAILIALLLSLLLCNILLKNAVDRPRPFQLEEVTLLVPPPGEFSFPSGHASSSFAAATALFCLHKKGGAAALCLAAVIAFSRLYLFEMCIRDRYHHRRYSPSRTGRI